MFEPVYLAKDNRKRIKEKITWAYRQLKQCNLCPRKCNVNRLEEERGICNTGKKAMVSSYAPHFGEEAPLVGNFGSGTLFFTNCSLHCCFCQNYDISNHGIGQEVSPEDLANMMISLQHKGCHNINFVTPSHVVPPILEAVDIAIDKGLNIPLIYNSSGYDKPETIRVLEGIIDIYMPDFKFWSVDVAKKTCRAFDYPAMARSSLKEMHRQVGNLFIDADGIAKRGLLVRHLVMPEKMAGTKEVMEFIATEISVNTFVNVMEQYHPCGEVLTVDSLSRPISSEEFQNALHETKKSGITNIL